MDELVPSELWAEFCRNFTRQHRGWLVTVEHGAAGGEVRGSDRSSPPIAEFRSLELAGNGPRRQLYITTAGRPGAEQLSTVRQPVRIWFEQTQTGGHRGVRIEGSAGETLVLRFRTAPRPETLDGLIAPVHRG